jgi:hypothetical protein
VVESQPSKLLVAGSIPVSRSSLRRAEAIEFARLWLGKPSGAIAKAGFGLASHRKMNWKPTRADLSGRSCERSERLAEADVAQLAERVLGKDEVTSSILVIGSR